MRAFITGVACPALTNEERQFLREAEPWGLIVFARNISGPGPLRRLIGEFRSAVGRDAPVLIDQEGGRVQRLGPPHWPRYPPGRAYGDLPANDPLTRREIVRLGARLMAHDLATLGINVDCAPVLDVPQPGAHDIIGDRAYAQSAEDVAVLGRA